MIKILARNKKAYHNFEILQKYEAGLSLRGSEVKAIKGKRVSISESFVKIVKEEPFLFNMNVSYFGNIHQSERLDEKRSRKLLLHKREIRKLIGKTNIQGLALIPTSIYIKNRLIKIEVALARGKKLYDKRQELKKKQMEREKMANFKKLYN